VVASLRTTSLPHTKQHYTTFTLCFDLSSLYCSGSTAFYECSGGFLTDHFPAATKAIWHFDVTLTYSTLKPCALFQLRSGGFLTDHFPAANKQHYTT
jgi:hypothetical protein